MLNCFIGKFAATASFDYESGGKYGVVVNAASGSSQSNTNVEVSIQDTTDPPTFKESKFEISLPEDTAAGTTVTYKPNTLVIVDQDTSKENFICTLEKITSVEVLDTFKVTNDQGTCKLVTQAGIDHHKTPQFSFEVRATDKNYLNMYASADVVVKVEDKNNHSPEFSQDDYWVSVSSSKTQKTESILTVTAVDKDAGTNADIVFQLLQSVDSHRYCTVFKQYTIFEQSCQEYFRKSNYV